MADEYIVIRGLSERENGRWYNVSRMNRIREYAEAAAGRSSTRASLAQRSSTRTRLGKHDTAVYSGSSVTLEATGVLEFGQYGGVAEVYRPVDK